MSGRQMTAPFPEHWQSRVDEIEEELDHLPPGFGPSTVLFGDSLSEWHPATQLRGRPIFNMGIAGDQAEHGEGGLLRRVHLVPRANPAEIFLLIGINDLNNQKPPATLVQQIGRVIAGLQEHAPGAKIYLQNLMPTNGPRAHLLPLVRATNPLIAHLAHERELPLLDLYSAMVDESDQLREEYTYDGVHLSEDGYAAWTAVIEAAK